MPKKLAIVSTHPIQYYAPLFSLLAKKIDLMVFYTWGEASLKKFDPGFGKIIEWDLPLLKGYPYSFVNNTSLKPGSHHFKGIVNPNLINDVKDFKPDAILVIGYAYHSHLQILRYFKGKVPLWFRGDSTLLDEKNSLKSIAKWIYLKWIYSHINKAFYVGTNNKLYFKKYGLREDQLIFAPHAIDNARFAENRRDEVRELRLNFEIEEGDLLILFAGKLEPKKNPELLLDAFTEIIPELGPEHHTKERLHLLFVGNGVLEEKLKTKSQKLKNVHFMDFQNQSQMPVVYQACDIFCLPSQGPGETWGLAVNEAMAAGKSVIVSEKVGCAKDLVQPNINGQIFINQDKADLKKAIKMLIASDLAKLGNASSSIISKWTINIQAEKIITALNNE